MEQKKLERIFAEKEIGPFLPGGKKPSKARLNRMINAGQFPKPVRLVPNGKARGWFESDLLAYQAKVRAEADKPFTAIKRGAKGRMVKAS